MPRALDASLTSAWRLAATSYIRLYELATGSTPATLRWTRYGDVTFGGNAYHRRLTEHGKQAVGTQGKQASFDVTVDDVDGTFAAFIAAGFDFQTRRFTVHRTIAANLGAGSLSHKDVYLVDTWVRKGSRIVFTLKSRLSAFSVQCPREVLTLERFPFIPQETS